MSDIRLGRLPSPEEERAEYRKRFALTPRTLPDKPVFVHFGLDWFSSFSEPRKDRDGHYWIGKGIRLFRQWGKIAGGHAIMAPPVNAVYDRDLFKFYNQGQTPMCVAYSACFGMTLLNGGQRYRPEPLYHQAQIVYDKIPGPPPKYDGTEVRAGEECMRVEGLWRIGEYVPTLADGIDAYRSASTIEQIHQARGTDINLGYTELWQTWGLPYGEGGRVRIPDDALNYLIHRPYSDAFVPCDR